MTIPNNAIQTHIGYFDFVNLNKDNVHIEDIAHSLSLLCRFGGHIKQFYSVAAHCCFVSDMMENDSFGKLSLAGLLHDAHEAYISDMTRPMKLHLKHNENIDFNKVVSDPLDKLIFEKFGLPYPHTEYLEASIKNYDNIALFTEKEFLFKNKEDWGWYVEPKTLEDFSMYMDNSRNWEREYLDRYERLSI